MEYLNRILRYKALIVAAIFFALGVGVLAYTLLSWFAPPLSHTPMETVATDASFDEPFDAEIAADLPEARIASVEDPNVIAYVSGAVRFPDVYLLPGGARVKDLVLAAGGLSDDADIERINLAALVTDGEHVSIPWIGMESVEPTVVQAAPNAESGGLVDLNRATIAELDALPGIGMTLAGRIVASRENEGPFQSVNDLSRVEGLGPSVLAKIAPLVTVGQ